MKTTDNQITPQDISDRPAVGEITIFGVGAYTLIGAFYDAGDLTKGIGLTSTRVGEIVDASESELTGFFHVNPNDYVGTCVYSLDSVDVGEGGMRLVIKSANEDTTIATFYGDSEGFGEAFVINKKGSLHIIPKDHNNVVRFVDNGDGTIKSILFEPVGEIVTEGQTYYGMNYGHSDGNQNDLFIDFQAGSKMSKECAEYFNHSVESDDSHMIHTERGDNKPQELSFAFSGTLTINGDAYAVCIGQGGYAWVNNWHFASLSLKDTGHGKKGELGKYELTADGSNAFKIKEK